MATALLDDTFMPRCLFEKNLKTSKVKAQFLKIFLNLFIIYVWTPIGLYLTL